jgi:asparagine synthase (glutamine-hydrolysing)
VGSGLSGGMDSSSVVCVARELLSQNGGGRLKTFSAIFDEVPESDERHFIQALLAQGQLEPCFINLDSISPLAHVEKIFWHEDEPACLPHLFLWWELYGAAHQRGVRVFLDGAEGDSVVSYGFEYLRELLYNGRWLSLAREAKGLAHRYEMPAFRCLWNFGLKPIVPHRIMPLIYRSLGRRWEDMARTTVNPRFAEGIGLAARNRAFKRSVPKKAKPSRGEHWLRMTHGIEPYALEVLDKAAAAFALEPRHPFYDRRVMEFCLALPAAQKMNQGWNRIILRRGLAQLLPPEVRERGSKTSLRPHLERGLRLFEKARVEEVLFNPPSVIQEYVNLPAVRQDYGAFLLQKRGDYVFNVWKVVILSLWLGQEGIENRRTQRQQQGAMAPGRG